jgi:hypothetical protein
MVTLPSLGKICLNSVCAMKPLRNTSVLVSASELAEIVGIDNETVNNWLRYGIITRAPVGGRQLRNRLFSADEVYKTALKNELVKLGIPPSQASEAVNSLWREWGKKDVPEGWNVYALLWPSNDKWIVALCSQKSSGRPLYKFGKSKLTEEIDFPKRTCALIPISEIMERVSSKLSELLGEVKNQEAKGKP